jgi:E3 ubiquitin-protein ligase TRIP12
VILFLAEHSQYWVEIGQPERKNFIARKLSYHGNTLGALSLSHHPARKGPYTPILNSNVFHHVSPAYAARFKQDSESELEYVERLREELESKIKELGPETVIGCKLLQIPRSRF